METNCPRNKVLIAFDSTAGDLSPSRSELLERIFGLDADRAQESIVKDLTWRTKYYQCQYDLYVDEFEDIKSWLTDLNTPDCEELRAVLAGVILVTHYDPTRTALLDQFSGVKCQDSFLVWCNTSQAIDEEMTDCANSTMSSGNVNAEMVNLQCSKGTNEYGEKTGLARLKEIIDTYEWANLGPATVSQETHPPTTDNLEAVVAKLQRARAHYQSLPEGDDNASSLAAALAEEISELL